MEQQRVVYEVSLRSILKIIGVLVLLWFVYLVKAAVVIIFVALVLASALDPWVDRLQQWGLPRWLALLLIYILALGGFGLVIGLLIPPLVEQITGIAKSLPFYFETLTRKLDNFREFSLQYGILDNIQQSISTLASSLGNTTGDILGWVGSLFGGVFSLLAVAGLVFYMTIEESAMKRFLHTVLPQKYQPYSIRLINRIQFKLGYWIRGQLVLSVAITILAYIGLRIADVPYALALALVAGAFEFVPYIGPIFAAVPAVFIGLVQSPYLALYIMLWYMGMQLFENQVLVPKVMERAVGLNPIVVLISLLIGAQLGGMVGMILAVPTATILSIIGADFVDLRDAHTSERERRIHKPR